MSTRERNRQGRVRPLWLALLAATVILAPASAETLLLANVHVLPMDTERVLEGQSVLVVDGVLRAIGATGSVRAPPDAQVIDGTGAYLMPGLSDLHAHISGYALGESEEGLSQVAANQLLLYLATGVTLLRDTSGSDAHRGYRRLLESGKELGPELHFTTPVLEGENAVWDFSVKLFDPAEVERQIARYRSEGYWGVKTYHTLSAGVFEAVVRAARKHDLPVVGHVPFGVGIDRALELGMTTVEHLRGYDFDGLSPEELTADGGRSAKRFRVISEMSDERMEELVQQTLVAGTWNTPTLAVNRFLFDAEARAALAQHPRFRHVHPTLQGMVLNANALDAIFSPEAKAALRDVLPDQQKLIRRLHQAGAGILIGTDATVPAWVPGFTPIDEMQLIEQAGVSRFEVLQAATRDAAAVLGIEAERGTVSVGKRASLILLGDNPLDDLEHLWSLRGVVHQGRWLSRQTLEARLEEQAQTRERDEGGAQR